MLLGDHCNGSWETELFSGYTMDKPRITIQSTINSLNNFKIYSVKSYTVDKKLYIDKAYSVNKLYTF